MSKTSGSTPHPVKKKQQSTAYHHGDLRAALLKAARKALEAGASEKISLKALATRLGVSQSAPYRHFSRRESLLAAVATDGFQQFQSEIHRASEADGPEPALERCCLAYLSFSRRNPGLYRLMFASELLHRDQDEPLQQSAKLAFRELLARVQSAVPSQTPATAAWIWMTMHGLAMIEMAGLLLGPASQKLAAIDVVQEMTKRLKAGRAGS